MSGAEFIALLSIGASAIQVVETCLKVLDRIQQFRQNAVFQDLALQLPLLIQDIEALNSPDYRQLLDATTEKALVRVLEGCHRQLDALDKLIQTMTPTETSSKLKQTWKGIRSFRKDAKLRGIMGILTEYKSTITLHLCSRHIQDFGKAGTPPNVTKSFFDVPTQRVSHFVSRSQIQDRIRSTIAASMLNPSVVVLTGVGGQGKTQLSLEFCRQSISDYRVIFWIDASSEASTMRGFKKIAAKICETGQSFADIQAEIAFVKDTLRTWPEPWLLVFDNYDLPRVFENLTSFFPASNGVAKNVILVTSRNVSSERLGSCVKIEGLTEEEALELLYSRSPITQKTSEDLNEGKKIVKQLGYLALAVDQAAAYISARQLPLSLFKEHYERRKEFILKHTPDSLWEYRARMDESDHGPGQNLSVLTTWELSFEQISGDKKQREELGDFLTQSAFFNPTTISESLFSSFFQYCIDSRGERPSWMDLFVCEGTWEAFRFQDLIVGLKNLSLIQTMLVTSDGLKFSLHPLIKDWLQLRKSLQIRRELTFTAISMTASLIRDTDPENLPLQTRQELLGHVDSCAENTQQYMKTDESRRLYGGLKEGFQTVLATFYGSHDRHADAEKLFTEALACQQMELGLYHVETMCTMNELGALYLEMGKVVNAEGMLKQSLLAKEIALGPDHPRTLNTVNNIGNLYSLQLELDKAAMMYQRTLQGYTKIHGPQHKTVAEAWNNLGEVSMKQGNFTTAEQQFKTALEMVQTLDGSDSTFILYIKSNLALVYKFERRYDVAIELYNQIITGRTSMLGLNHSSALRSMCELGDVYLAAGELDQAENCYVNGKASVERKKKAQLELKAQEDASETQKKPALHASNQTNESNPKRQGTSVFIDHLDNDESMEADPKEYSPTRDQKMEYRFTEDPPQHPPQAALPTYDGSSWGIAEPRSEPSQNFVPTRGYSAFPTAHSFGRSGWGFFQHSGAPPPGSQAYGRIGHQMKQPNYGKPPPQEVIDRMDWSPAQPMQRYLPKPQAADRSGWGQMTQARSFGRHGYPQAQSLSPYPLELQSPDRSGYSHAQPHSCHPRSMTNGIFMSPPLDGAPPDTQNPVRNGGVNRESIERGGTYMHNG
ncbi:hypothetical protein FGG08_004080 [Glutinoglossum americanum]|uniref:Uncharacterized protein n=1 Tax=Glutinoglossum americanum TaxID=1670608 RepID=A0A9P8I8C2_9PEZI|nr:hypothetical protein FGG08_004080 [Glutinoglossum americanum]